MTQARRDLHNRLCREPWFATTGEGDGRIVVFVHREPHAGDRLRVPPAYGGYPVVLRYHKREGRS